MRTAGVGDYSFTVTAVGDNINYATTESDKSGSQTVIQRPQAATLALNEATGVLTWAAGAGDTTSLGYKVELYKDSGETAIESDASVAGTTKTFANDFTVGNHSYEIKVTANGNAALVLDADAATLTKEVWNDMWLVGMEYPWTLPGVHKSKDNDTFTWTVVDVAANSTFRFHLTDTSLWEDDNPFTGEIGNNKWNGSWFAPDPEDYPEGGLPVTLGNDGNPMTRFYAKTENAWKISAAGSYTLTVDPAGMKFYAEKLPDVPAVIDVTIDPKTVSVEKGTTKQFSVDVQVTGTPAPAKTVNWSVSGNNSAQTAISGTGLLTVAAAETAATLTVTATSTVAGFTDKKDTATVTVTLINNVWLVGTMTGWGDTFPPGRPMTKETDGTFTWMGDVAADSTFRFSLKDTTTWTDKWNGSWFAPPDPYVEGGKEATLDDIENVMFRFDTNSGGTTATDNVWKITQAGYYKFTVNPATMKLRVEEPDITGAEVTLTIEDKGSGLTITDGIPAATPIIYRTEGTPTSVTFTVDNPDAAYTYNWYVNGVKTTGTNVICNAAAYGIGYHSVLLTVTIPGGGTWSMPGKLGFEVR
jgi:hypothetical protein